MIKPESWKYPWRVGAQAHQHPRIAWEVQIWVLMFAWTWSSDSYREVCCIGISNHWNEIWNGTMEWKMESNSEHTQLQLNRVTGAAQSRLNCLVIFRSVISPQKLYEQVWHCPPSYFYIQAWYRCWLIIRCFANFLAKPDLLSMHCNVRHHYCHLPNIFKKSQW